MSKVGGMDILEYIDHLMDQGISEENAYEIADAEFSAAKASQSCEVQSARVVDASDCRVFYGILSWKNPDIRPTAVQRKIYEIKMSASDQGIDDWDIDYLLDRFPESWGVSFTNCDPLIEI